jgi:lipid A ethanolaminephosphotransferase
MGDSVTTYIADSEDVSTIGGVKAILDHKKTGELYEILPNYMFRNGVDVVWRTANWGQPPLHIDKYIDHNGLADRYPAADRKYDGVLIAGLADEIQNCDKDKQLIVLHCSTSHGPRYFDKYPSEFNRFTPVCTNVEISSADKEGLVNAYDNTILYTDYLLHSVIETLQQVSDRRCCMIYVSDHGESLGENDMFMHGTMPRSLAPKQQYEIPFIVWENDGATRTKELESVRQFYVFHSVMNWFGMQSPVYNEEMNVFEPVE